MGRILMNFKSQDFLKMLYNFLWKNYMKRYKQGGEAQAKCYAIFRPGLTSQLYIHLLVWSVVLGF